MRNSQHGTPCTYVGADIEATGEDGCSALVNGAIYGHLAVVKYLVERGADKEVAGNSGRTPLLWAARGGYLDIVR